MTPEEKKYIDARNDILKAAKSVNDLAPWQRDQLFKELLETGAFVAMCNMIQPYWK